MQGLHSHFMAEWKPARPWQVRAGNRCSFLKQAKPFYCAMQHRKVRLDVKFNVTFSCALFYCDNITERTG